MLELKDIHAGYGSLGVLRGINLRVEEGEVVALLGTNGAGKTTLLRTIAGLHRPSSGQILFQRRPLQAMQPHLIQASGLALVPEGRQLFPEHTVLENLELGAVSTHSQTQRGGSRRSHGVLHAQSVGIHRQRLV